MRHIGDLHRGPGIGTSDLAHELELGERVVMPPPMGCRVRFSTGDAVTRLPQALSVNADRPSCLGYSAADPGIVTATWIELHMTPSDHAFVIADVGPPPATPRRRTNSIPRSWGEALSAASED